MLDRIVTNRHVVAHAAHIYVSAVISTVEREVRISWLDEVADLALLTINQSGALTIEKARRTPLIKLPAGVEFVDPVNILRKHRARR